MMFFNFNKKKTPQIDEAWMDIYNILMELAISMFKWKNLPSTVNARYLELSLFQYGKVAFFKDDVMDDFLALKSSTAGKLNVYYEPTSIMAYGGDAYQHKLENNKDAVIIYNNFVRDTPQRRIMQYAQRIYNIERTIDINVHAQRTPLFLKTSKKQELTIKNIYKQYDGYTPVIIVDEEFDTSKLDVMNTNAPFVADKLEEEKRKLWAEALSFIGIENNFSEKSERLTQGEVLVSIGLAIASRNSKLNARKLGVEQINKMFGLDIDVEISNESILEYASNGEDGHVETEEVGGGENE